MSGGATRRLVGVGVGPGDPELVTVKAVRELRAAGTVFVPVLDLAEQGRAERTVRAHLPEPAAGDVDPVQRLAFALDDRGGLTGPREQAWQQAAAAVAARLRRDGGTVAFATLGDPAVYSTFAYLSATVRELLPGVRVDTVPGITAMQDLAARTGISLCEGTESLALLPLTAGVAAFRAALDGHDTVVGYKGGSRMAEVLDALAAAGRLDGAVYGAALGLPAEQLGTAAELRAALAAGGSAPYLSTLLVPARRRGRGSRL